MAYPEEARNSCHQCNGWYNSDSEFYQHMQTVHRRCVPQQSTFPREVTQTKDLDIYKPTSKNEWRERIRAKEKVNLD